jgi:hypothetical protein
MHDSQPRRRRALLTGGILAGVGAASFFLVGLEPGYLFELDNRMNAHVYCPTPFDSEASFDQECALAIVRRGPLYLGRWALAASFILGVASIVMVWKADRRRLRWPRVTLPLVIGMYGFSWSLLLLWNAAEGARLGHPGVYIAS